MDETSGLRKFLAWLPREEAANHTIPRHVPVSVRAPGISRYHVVGLCISCIPYNGPRRPEVSYLSPTCVMQPASQRDATQHGLRSHACTQLHGQKPRTDPATTLVGRGVGGVPGGHEDDDDDVSRRRLILLVVETVLRMGLISVAIFLERAYIFSSVSFLYSPTSILVVISLPVL